MAMRQTLLHGNHDRVLEEAAGILEDGGIVAIPTETFYALAASPFNEEAVARVARLKGEREAKPILVLIGSRQHLDVLAAGVPPAARLLMNAFWPGPVTVIVPASPRLATPVTGGTGTVGVRHTSCTEIHGLLERVGPLTGTSANRTGQPAAQTAQQVEAWLGEEVDMILDAGPTPGGEPSTVVDTVGPVRIVREGCVPAIQILSVLKPLDIV